MEELSYVSVRDADLQLKTKKYLTGRFNCVTMLIEDYTLPTIHITWSQNEVLEMLGRLNRQQTYKTMCGKRAKSMTMSTLASASNCEACIKAHARESFAQQDLQAQLEVLVIAAKL